MVRKEQQKQEGLWEKVQQEAATALSLAEGLQLELYPLLPSPGSPVLLLQHLAMLQTKLGHTQRLGSSLLHLADQCSSLARERGEEADRLAGRLGEEARRVQIRLEEYSQVLVTVTGFLKSLEKVRNIRNRVITHCFRLRIC